jgi:hypothetical protein
MGVRSTCSGVIRRTKEDGAKKIGVVTEYNEVTHRGCVTLDGYTDCSEYGDLDGDCTVTNRVYTPLCA